MGGNGHHVRSCMTRLHILSPYGLSHRFPRAMPGETRNRFAHRMKRVESYLNSKEFATCDGGGLHALAQGMRGRFDRLKELQGERLRT